MPEELAVHVTRLMTNSNSCTSSFSQRAALAALTGPQEPVEAMMAEFRRRRDIFVEGLNTIPGVRCAMPGGAFYAFPNVSQVSRSSKELADYLLQTGGVASLAGVDFGVYGEGYLRFPMPTRRRTCARPWSALPTVSTHLGIVKAADRRGGRWKHFVLMASDSGSR